MVLNRSKTIFKVIRTYHIKQLSRYIHYQCEFEQNDLEVLIALPVTGTTTGKLYITITGTSNVGWILPMPPSRANATSVERTSAGSYSLQTRLQV